MRRHSLSATPRGDLESSMRQAGHRDGAGARHDAVLGAPQGCPESGATAAGSGGGGPQQARGSTARPGPEFYRGSRGPTELQRLGQQAPLPVAPLHDRGRRGALRAGGGLAGPRAGGGSTATLAVATRTSGRIATRTSSHRGSATGRRGDAARPEMTRPAGTRLAEATAVGPGADAWAPAASPVPCARAPVPHCAYWVCTGRAPRRRGRSATSP